MSARIGTFVLSPSTPFVLSLSKHVARRFGAPLLALLLVAAAPADPVSSPHFTFAGSGLDPILVPYLSSALEAERARLAAAGASVPEGKLPVTVAAGPQELDRLTSLDAKDIAAGHAAACEEGRLVVASPRAAVGGYPWIDAAVGEYARCASGSRALPATVPVRWKGDPPPRRAAGSGEAGLAHDYMRLGDILRARGRAVPARIEYEKAVRRGGAGDPDVVARYAQATLAAGEAGKVEAALREVAKDHPRHAGVQAVLGRLDLQQGQWAAARDAFVATMRVDPYDAEAHAGLATALEKLGDASGASREKKFGEMLRR